ncbi:hypothetical protein Drorol1_Dr00010387 [Drosera rotundifolia]
MITFSPFILLLLTVVVFPLCTAFPLGEEILNLHTQQPPSFPPSSPFLARRTSPSPSPPASSPRVVGAQGRNIPTLTPQLLWREMKMHRSDLRGETLDLRSMH